MYQTKKIANTMLRYVPADLCLQARKDMVMQCNVPQTALLIPKLP